MIDVIAGSNLAWLVLSIHQKGFVAGLEGRFVITTHAVGASEHFIDVTPEVEAMPCIIFLAEEVVASLRNVLVNVPVPPVPFTQAATSPTPPPVYVAVVI